MPNTLIFLLISLENEGKKNQPTNAILCEAIRYEVKIYSLF